MMSWVRAGLDLGKPKQTRPRAARWANPLKLQVRLHRHGVAPIQIDNIWQMIVQGHATHALEAVDQQPKG